MEKEILNVENIDAFNKIIETEDAALFYFSHEKCNVCKVLKPKLAEMLEENFPKLKMYYADTVTAPEIAGQNRVFAVPTIVVYFGGREFSRKSRSIGVSELVMELERPYQLIFDEN